MATVSMQIRSPSSPPPKSHRVRRRRRRERRRRRSRLRRWKRRWGSVNRLEHREIREDPTPLLNRHDQSWPKYPDRRRPTTRRAIDYGPGSHGSGPEPTPRFFISPEAADRPSDLQDLVAMLLSIDDVRVPQRTGCFQVRKY
jgi:hypothetical protein